MNVPFDRFDKMLQSKTYKQRGNMHHRFSSEQQTIYRHESLSYLKRYFNDFQKQYHGVCRNWTINLIAFQSVDFFTHPDYEVDVLQQRCAIYLTVFFIWTKKAATKALNLPCNTYLFALESLPLPTLSLTPHLGKLIVAIVLSSSSPKLKL